MHIILVKYLRKFDQSILDWTPALVEGRALRYYRIGIESPILLEKSIVSVSYQYRNSTTRKYQLSISIKNTIFKSISIVSVSLF